jgi:hypothetical protein
VRARTLVGVGLLALAGCHSPVTEVVVVVDTDLSTPSEANTLQLQITSADANATQVFGGAGQSTLPIFPATIGLLPGPGAPVPFTVTATLSLTNPQTRSPQIVAVRKASDVQFVHGQTRALVLTLLRACACKGTNCPAPTSTSPCGDLVTPTLTPFDPNRIPHVDGGASASVDGGVDVAADVLTNHDAALEGLVEVGEDAPRDIAPDRAAEVEPDASPADVGVDAPARFALGHACAATSQCQDGVCVDGVCCESQCACGTCGAGGTCTPVMAGTDPRDACGPYTCDGAGACVTTCPQTYGECNSPCKAGAFCDGAGVCRTSIGMAGSFCVVGTCTCIAGLSCRPPDAGGAGVCM